MKTQFDGILIVVGNYGSGKSEVSINLAIRQKEMGVDVTIADLDLVNPYFRTREARRILAARQISVVLPPSTYMHADLPILDPKVSGAIKKKGGLTLLDVGGDNVGATVLAALQDHFSDKTYHMLQVVNPFRPNTNSVRGCLAILESIQKASKMKISGLIGNPHLMDETRPEDIYEGYLFLKGFSKEVGLPIAFMSVMAEHLPSVDISGFDCPILPMYRHLAFPWSKKGNV